MAALYADAVCLVIPYGTGGGLAVRVGGELAVQGALKLPAGIRALQGVLKLSQLSQMVDGKGGSQKPTGELKSGTKVNEGAKIDPDDISLGKKSEAYTSQRGWSLDSIKNVVGNPAETRSNPNIVNRRNRNPVTYYYRPDGHYVVIDDVTGEVVQVSDINDPNWIDEMTDLPIEPIEP